MLKLQAENDLIEIEKRASSKSQRKQSDFGDMSLNNMSLETSNVLPLYRRERLKIMGGGGL